MNLYNGAVNFFGIQRPKPSPPKKRQLFLHLSHSHPPIQQTICLFLSIFQVPSAALQKHFGHLLNQGWQRGYRGMLCGIGGSWAKKPISWWNWGNTGYEIHKYSCKWHNQTERLSPHLIQHFKQSWCVQTKQHSTYASWVAPMEKKEASGVQSCFMESKRSFHVV